MTPARLFSLCAAAALLFWGVRQTATPPPDSALFAGDSWEYHSMGVNFARGHGLVAGRREPLDDYRFDGIATHPRLLEHFEGAGRDPRPYHTYRTPAYPLFLGLVYRTMGTSPRRAYQVQELLLILMAFGLPPAGLWIAGRAGAAAGLFSGIWFLSTSLDMGTEMMTETLIVVHLFLMFLAFHAAGKKRTPLRMALWGLAAGLAPLVKGSLVFMPGLALVWELVRAGRSGGRAARPLILFCAGLAAPVLLWSVCVSRIEGRPVFLSTQGNAVLLEGNNELSLADGAWHPEYKADRPFWIESGVDTSALYYNRPDVRAKSIPAQLAGFFALHGKDAPRLFLNKFNRAFERFPPFKALVVTVLWLALAALLRLPPGAAAKRLGLLALLLGVGFALRFVHPSFAEIGVWVAAATPVAALAAWKRGLRLPLDPFTIIAFVNFTLITLMTFGLRRFVQVLDPLLLYTTGLVVLHAATLTFRPPPSDLRPLTSDL